MLHTLRAELSPESFSCSLLPEERERSTGCEVWLRLGKQAGDFHSNQERKEHTSALEFAMQAAGWRGSAFHSWIGKAIREDHCLILMLPHPWRLSWLVPPPPTVRSTPWEREVLMRPPNVVGLPWDGEGDMESIWTSLLKNPGN